MNTEDEKVAPAGHFLFGFELSAGGATIGETSYAILYNGTYQKQDRYRIFPPRLYDAHAGGAEFQGLVPVSQGKDALVYGIAGTAIVALLRLRSRR
jgi:hypothetical protein